MTYAPHKTLDQARANPVEFLWELRAQGLRWADEMAAEFGVNADPLVTVLLEQFDVVDAPAGETLIRRRMVERAGSRWGSEPAEIDLFAYAEHATRDGGDAVRVIYAYVRKRLTMKARALLDRKRKHEEDPNRATVSALTREPASPHEAPHPWSETNELMRLLSDRVDRESLELFVGRKVQGRSVRAIAEQIGRSREYVQRRIDRVDAIAAFFSGRE